LTGLLPIKLLQNPFRYSKSMFEDLALRYAYCDFKTFIVCTCPQKNMMGSFQSNGTLHVNTSYAHSISNPARSITIVSTSHPLSTYRQ